MSKLATFGAGCFWGVENEFRREKGVLETTVGYAGGHQDHPTYEDVCTDETGHAEVVQVEYDPKIISYRDLLEIFWSIHDPTSLNRQGPDEGRQYRSVIFYHDAEQKRLAEETRDALARSGEFQQPMVTEISPAPEFYAAEEYHQHYVEKGGQAACHFRRNRSGPV